MTNKKYPSRYSSGKQVGAAQYIAELACEKMAKRNKKELPQKFWNIPEWKKSYKSQLLAARGLLKIYSEVAIIRALNSSRAFGIYSLRAPQLDDIIKEQQRLLDIEKEKPKTTEVKRADTTSKPRDSIVKKTNLGKLRELDL